MYSKSFFQKDIRYYDYLSLIIDKGVDEEYSNYIKLTEILKV